MRDSLGWWIVDDIGFRSLRDTIDTEVWHWEGCELAHLACCVMTTDIFLGDNRFE